MFHLARNDNSMKSSKGFACSATKTTIFAITSLFLFFSSMKDVNAQDQAETITGSKILNGPALYELYDRGSQLFESGDCEGAVEIFEATISQAARTINLFNLASDAFSDRSREEQMALRRFVPTDARTGLIYSIELESQVESIEQLTLEATLQLSECYLNLERYDAAVLALGAYLNTVPVIEQNLSRVEPQPDKWLRALQFLLSIPQPN